MPNTHHHNSSTSLIVLKAPISTASSEITTQNKNVYTLPVIKSFDNEESRPLIIPQEHIQPIEVHILENNHKAKYNHKLCNLIERTSYDLALTNEKLNII